MLNKSDILSILVNLEDQGFKVNPYIEKLMISKEIPVDVLKFIAQNQGIELVNFYEMLRKKHNQQKSPLYTNILKEKYENNEPIITLTCLLTQIVLYGNKLSDADSFFKEARAEEISSTITEYFRSNDTTKSINLLKLIKTDLLVLEYLNDRRELA